MAITVFSFAAHQAVQAQDGRIIYGEGYTFFNGEQHNFKLYERTESGRIYVPPGQSKLVIKLIGSFHFSQGLPGIYVSKDDPLWLIYSVGTHGSYWDSNRRWGGFGGTTEIVISNPDPAEGYYYFAPWRLFDYQNFGWPDSYTIKAEYFPQPPSIISITSGQQGANLGGTASLSVYATGTNLTYSWEKRVNGTTSRISPSANSSADTATLVLTDLKASDTAEYRAIVSNSGGTNTSSWFTLTIRIPPSITAHPQPRKVMPGGSATFSVTATGTAPLSYRWEHQELNGNIRTIVGATNSNLNVNNVNYLTHAGAYRVWVMNTASPAGVASTWGTLTVGPNIVGPVPTSPSVNEGAPLSVTASALGTAPLVYNWFLNGQLRQSGFSDTLNLASTRETDDGTWRLDVTNLAGKVSQSFTVTVIPPPTPPSFLLSPSAKSLTEGEILTLESRALGTRPIAYQWFQDGMPVADATGASLVITNATPAQAGQWWVRATNTLGQSTTLPVTVSISAGPKIVRQPANTEIPPGGSVTLSVEAIGRVPLGYQWFKNGQPLGVTGPQLTITNAARTDSGFYYAVVTNGLGNSLASVPARLTVKEGALLLGSVLWKYTWPEAPTFGVSPDDQQIILTELGDVLVKRVNGADMLDSTGKILWTEPANYPRAIQQVMAIPNGSALLLFNKNSGRTNQIHALNRSGENIWQRFPRQQTSRVSQFALNTNNDLLIAKQDLGWSYQNPSPFDPPNAYIHSLSRLAIGGPGNGVTIFEGSPGRSVSDEKCAVAVHRDGAIVFRAVWLGVNPAEPYPESRDDGILCKFIDSSFFPLVRQWEVGGDGFFDPLILVLGSQGETLYSTGFGGVTQPGYTKLTLLNANASLGWQVNDYNYEPFVYDKNSQLYANRKVRSSLDGQLEVQFNFPIGFNPSGKTPVLAEDGTVYLAGSLSNRAALLAVSSTGLTQWQFIAPVGQNGFSPNVGDDGTIYFPTELALYALKGAAPIMDSSWPVYGGNVRGTFRAQELPKVPILPSQAISRSGILTLNGTSTGPQPIRYQWLKDGERISNATNAMLAVTNLQGFDGGVYQVRVSNPTGDKLTQPANLKVSFDPAPFVGIGLSPEEAFTNSPPSANSRRDVWQFFCGINETNRTGRYSRMDIFTNLWQSPGLAGWSPAGDLSPVGGYNGSGAPVSALGASVPAGRVFLNPSNTPNGCVSLAYQAEIAGYYSVTGQLSRLALDASGDGVRWYLDVSALNVLSGTLANSAAETNLAVAGIYLNRGELLHLILSPGSNSLGDLTGVELDVRLTEADPNSEPGFLQSPQNLSVLAGQNAAFIAQVDGFPEPVLQWQRSLNNGATWEAVVDGSDFTGVNTTNLQLYGVTLEMNGQLFRMEAINAAGSAVSGVAKLTVTEGAAAPSFFAQPQGLMTVSGGLAILSAQASGAGPLTYQWFRDGQLLSGQTGATLRLNTTSPLDAGAYCVVVANALGSQTSSVALLSVDLPPQPPVMGLVTTTNGPKISLQSVAGSSWKIQRSSALGAAWDTMALSTADITGGLSVVDTNPPSATAFYQAKLNLPTTLPEITAQPLTTTFKIGGVGALSVGVEGVAPFRFQWWKDGALLSGETNQTLLVSGVVTNRAGNYFVVVSNAYGAATSEVAVVTVAPPPVIVKVENIMATATSELKSYSRVLANLFSDIANGQVWESVGVGGFGEDRNPAITFDLQGIYQLSSFKIWNGPEFDPSVKRMSVEYSRDGIQFDSLGEIQVSLSTGSFPALGEAFDLQSIQARYFRFVFLENYAGQVFPVVGTPTVWSLVMIDQVEFYGEFLSSVPPEITRQPVSVTNCLPGISVALNITAKGTPPLTYQWWHGGDLIANATNQTLTIGSLAPSDGGRYSMVVSNIGGEIVSVPAFVTVNTNATTLPLASAGLLAYYPLDNTTNDFSGNGRHAQNFGGKITRDRHGVLGGALSFTNLAYMTVDNLDPDDYPTGFSFGCWFRPDDAGGANFLLYWIPTGSWGQTYVSQGSQSFGLRLGSGSPSTDHGISGLAVMPQGQWQHVMVTHGAAFDRLYLNGVMLAEWPTLPLLNNAATLFIGNSIQGAIDDVTIYGRELSAIEVQALAIP